MNGKDIAKKRKELKLTQEDLAKALGVSRKTIQNYEKGDPIPDTKRELLLNFISGSISGTQISVGNNTGNIAGGNFIQVTLPEEGTQKIIKSDGTVILESVSPNNKIASDLDPVGINIQDLLNTIALQKQLIESLQDQVTMLKGNKRNT